VARDTLDFVLRDMRTAQGGFVASFSAVDGDGNEGGVYLWSVDRLHALLGERDTALARRYWRMLDLPALDGGHLPRRGESAEVIAMALGEPADAVAARLKTVQKRLLDARAQRGLPVDNKLLAGWNGLLLAALSQAAKRWNDPALRMAAGRLRHYLRERLWDGRTLHRAVADGRPIGKASLADYAYVAYGMAHFAELSGDPGDRTFVAVLLNQAWRRYYGDVGWRTDDQPLIPGMAEQAAIADGALPSPSALLIRVAAKSDDPGLVVKARVAAELGRAKAQGEPFWYASQHAELLRLAGPP
jgi:uncharacterized protein YyaL (SSP411 family)